MGEKVDGERPIEGIRALGRAAYLALVSVCTAAACFLYGGFAISAVAAIYGTDAERHTVNASWGGFYVMVYAGFWLPLLAIGVLSERKGPKGIFYAIFVPAWIVFSVMIAVIERAYVLKF